MEGALGLALPETLVHQQSRFEFRRSTTHRRIRGAQHRRDASSVPAPLSRCEESCHLFRIWMSRISVGAMLLQYCPRFVRCRASSEKKGVRPIALSLFSECKCERQDLNLHGLPHWILNPARLPIPPLSRPLFLSFYGTLHSWGESTTPDTTPAA